MLINVFGVMIFKKKKVFGVMVNNLFKETFYGKKIINILTTFSIFYKSDVKTFLK